MARPIKAGIPYFPMDVDFLSDIKTRRIIREYGNEAIGVIMGVLVNIYRDNGYFIQVDDDISFIVAEEINTQEEVVDDVIKKAVEVNFFDKQLFDTYKILTSTGIQKRYVTACARRTRVEMVKEYLLLDKADLSDNINLIKVDIPLTETLINVDSNSENADRSTQSKVKERKGKNSKASSSSEGVPVTEEKIKKEDDEEEINKIVSCIDFWQQNVKINESMFVIESLDHWRKDFGAEGDEIVILAIQLMLKQGASNYSYLEKILKEWIGQKLDSVEKVKAYLKQRAAAHKPKSYNRQKTVKEVPNWMNNQPETPKQPEQVVEPESPTDLEVNAERLRAKMANLFGGDGDR